MRLVVEPLQLRQLYFGPDVHHNRYPRPCRASQFHHTWCMRNRPPEPRVGLYHTLGRRISRGWSWVPVVEVFNQGSGAEWRTAYRFNHIVQRVQHSNHSLGVSLGKVQPRSLFQTFMPQFVPENRHTNELVTDDQSL